MVAASEIARARAALEAARRGLLASAGGLTEAQFVERPARGGWCVAQVFEHLHRSENLITGRARVVVERGKGAERHWLDPLRRMPYRLGITEGVRVRTTPQLDPPDAAPRAEMVARLAESRAALDAFLGGLEGKNLDGLYLRHPFFGAFTVLEMMGFIAWHEQRHTNQVGRIRRAIGAA